MASRASARAPAPEQCRGLSHRRLLHQAGGERGGGPERRRHQRALRRRAGQRPGRLRHGAAGVRRHAHPQGRRRLQHHAHACSRTCGCTAWWTSSGATTGSIPTSWIRCAVFADCQENVSPQGRGSQAAGRHSTSAPTCRRSTRSSRTPASSSCARSRPATRCPTSGRQRSARSAPSSRRPGATCTPGPSYTGLDPGSQSAQPNPTVPRLDFFDQAVTPRWRSS